MNNTPLVSVIVPVYNVEKYLDLCVSSCVAQTYQHLEIILVDDGSTDESNAICKRWSQADRRITLICEQNQGVSAARNTGLRYAHGEFILFVDSDDVIDRTLVESCMDELQSNPMVDVVAYRYWNWWHDGYDDSCAGEDNSDEEESHNNLFNSGRLLTASEGVFSLLQGAIPSYPWEFIARSKLFAKGMQFPVGQLMEDYGTVYRIWGEARAIKLIDKPLYHYRRQRPGSILSDSGSRVRTLEDNLRNLPVMLSYVSKRFPERINDVRGICASIAFGTLTTLEDYRGSVTKERYIAIRKHAIEVFDKTTRSIRLLQRGIKIIVQSLLMHTRAYIPLQHMRHALIACRRGRWTKKD